MTLFKAGDIIRQKDSALRYIVRKADETGYYLEQWDDKDRLCRFTEPYKYEYRWELAPHSFRVDDIIRTKDNPPVKILAVTRDYTDVILTHSNSTELQYKIDNKNIQNYALRRNVPLSINVKCSECKNNLTESMTNFPFIGKPICSKCLRLKNSEQKEHKEDAKPNIDSVQTDDVFGEGDKVWLKINGAGPFVLVRLHSGLAPMRVPHHSTVDDIKAERAWIAQQVDGSLCYLWDSMLTKEEPPLKQSFVSKFVSGTVNWACMLASLAGAASIGWLIRDAIN